MQPIGTGRLGSVEGTEPTYAETSLHAGFVEMVTGTFPVTADACYAACNSATVADMSIFPINYHNGGDLAGISWNENEGICVCFSRIDHDTYQSNCRIIDGELVVCDGQEVYGCAYEAPITGECQCVLCDAFGSFVRGGGGARRVCVAKAVWCAHLVHNRASRLRGMMACCQPLPVASMSMSGLLCCLVVHASSGLRLYVCDAT